MKKTMDTSINNPAYLMRAIGLWSLGWILVFQVMAEVPKISQRQITSLAYEMNYIEAAATEVADARIEKKREIVDAFFEAKNREMWPAQEDVRRELAVLTKPVAVADPTTTSKRPSRRGLMGMIKTVERGFKRAVRAVYTQPLLQPSPCEVDRRLCDAFASGLSWSEIDRTVSLSHKMTEKDMEGLYQIAQKRAHDTERESNRAMRHRVMESILGKNKIPPKTAHAGATGNNLPIDPTPGQGPWGPGISGNTTYLD